MTIETIFLDFDGTILTYEEEPFVFHPQVIELLNGLSDRGISWCTNSGRWFDGQSAILAACKRRGLLHMPAALVCMESLVYIPDGKGGYCDAQPWNDKTTAQLTQHHRAVQACIEPHIEQWLQDHDVASYQFNRNSTYFQIMDHANAEQLHGKMDRLLSDAGIGRATLNGEWVLSCPDGLGKGPAMTEALRLLKRNPATALAVGDQFNDLSMIAGDIPWQSGCPGDARIEIKEAVERAHGYVASAPGPTGTIEVIKHFVEPMDD